MSGNQISGTPAGEQAANCPKNEGIEAERYCTMCGPKFCAMRITADVRRLRAENERDEKE